MSTRSTTHFVHEGVYGGEKQEPVAIIYRHINGYPGSAGTDILRFLDQCAELDKDRESQSGSRFEDPAYLAAKYVVFLADMFNVRYSFEDSALSESKAPSKLDFLSVGVVNEDPSDIEYRYVITCGARGTRPKVTCYKVSTGKKQKIPQPSKEAV
jgi:hypothetical protein